MTLVIPRVAKKKLPYSLLAAMTGLHRGKGGCSISKQGLELITIQSFQDLIATLIKYMACGFSLVKNWLEKEVLSKVRSWAQMAIAWSDYASIPTQNRARKLKDREENKRLASSRDVADESLNHGSRRGGGRSVNGSFKKRKSRNTKFQTLKARVKDKMGS